MSETPDSTGKPEMIVESETVDNAEVSETAAANNAVTDKSTSIALPAELDTADRTEDSSAAAAQPVAADKPARTETTSEAGPTGKAVSADKAEKEASAAPAAAKSVKEVAAEKAAKPVKADSIDKPAKPAAKPAAKQKPEDKPFADFIQEDLLPSLTKSLTERESAPISLALVEGERPVVGGQCWMVQGELPAGRRFWLCFASDAISSGKTIALAESGSDPSLLESFLIDEKRINQALLESRLLQRLNGQKWIGGN